LSAKFIQGSDSYGLFSLSEIVFVLFPLHWTRRPLIQKEKSTGDFVETKITGAVARSKLLSPLSF